MISVRGSASPGIARNRKDARDARHRNITISPQRRKDAKPIAKDIAMLTHRNIAPSHRRNHEDTERSRSIADINAETQRRRDRAQCRPRMVCSDRRQPAGRWSSSKGRGPRTREIRFPNAALGNRISRALNRAYGTTARPPGLQRFRSAAAASRCAARLPFLFQKCSSSAKPRRSRRAVGVASL